MKPVEREKAIEMRLSGEYSYGEIAKALNVSKSTLSRWLSDLPFSEELVLKSRKRAWQKTETKREKFRETMRAKREALERTVYEEKVESFVYISEQALLTAGLMLYEAEGDKKSRSDISFTNTDPDLIRFFMFWSMHFLEIPKGKFRFQLHLYENMDIPAEEQYWREQLDVPVKQFWKTQIRPLGPNSFTYKNAARHGTCKLYAGSVPKKTELRLSIRAFLDTYSEHLRHESTMCFPGPVACKKVKLRA